MRRLLTFLVLCAAPAVAQPPIFVGGGGSGGSVAPASFSSPTGTVTIGGSSGAVTLDAATSVLLSYVTGTSDPATCTVGSIFNLRTDSTLLKACSATNTWKTLAWSDQATDTFGALTDVTTNNASTSAHGFLKKLDNNAAHYMDGTGAWSTPAGGSMGFAFAGNYGNTTLSAGSTWYMRIGSSASSSEAANYWISPASCTARNLYVLTSGTQSTGGALTFTVRVNGSDTGITVSWSASEAGSLKSDTSNTASVTAGQTVTIKVNNAGGASSATISAWGFQCN